MLKAYTEYYIRKEDPLAKLLLGCFNLASVHTFSSIKVNCAFDVIF